MKRTILVLFSLLVAVSLFAVPVKITMLTSGDTQLDGTTLFKEAIAKLLKDFPNVEIEQLVVDMADGSTLTMDAQLKAGTAPNLYMDTAVRTSKYIVPEFALPLDGLVRDLAKYSPGVLDSFRRADGKLYALPMPGGAQGMLINLDIMKEIGYTVPKDWTIDDFLKMAELVKQKYGGQKWATGMFAGNQSGDYLLNNWFASFGVSFYAKGNYNKSTIADTGGAKVYKFYQDLVRAEYVPPYAATLNDDDYAAAWMVGKLAATAFFPSWTAPYFKTAMDQGMIKKPFEYKFVPFPRAPGVKAVPTYFSGSVMVGYKSKDAEANKITARLMEYFNDPGLQGQWSRIHNVMTNRADITIKNPDPRLAEITEIITKAGLQDVGLSDPRFTEHRALQYPILQRVLDLTVTPEAAISEYQAKLLGGEVKYILLLPAVVLFLLFVAWPLADLVKMSMMQTNFIIERYVGFDNYLASFRDAAFQRSIVNSLAYMAILVPAQTVGALVVALSASKLGKRWQDATRIILYLPSLTAGIIISQVWRWVFHIEGPINWALSKSGLGVVNWFGPGAAIPALSIILFISSLGGYVIIFLAAILGIDKSILDAAEIDGASHGQTSRLIVIPMIAPMIIVVVQLVVIAALQLFEYIYMLAPYEHSASVAYSVYQQGFQFSKWGMASAQAVILTLLIVGLTLTRRAVKA